jgi:two-component system chemotaxis response regulator CheB
LGGLHALQTLFAGLPEDFPAPMAVVQHRGRDTDVTLVSLLERHSALPVREAEDKEPIRPGWIYLAPADYHLLVEEGQFALSTEAPVWHARPSIDVLFETAAYTYGEKVIGILLSGANQDGAQGAARIKECGGVAIVQEPASAQSPVMPEAALATTAIDYILPLPGIASFLVNLIVRQ